ncbi:hypothetical protein [Halobellus rubicundus]|uniref:DUF8163 domain-containing protein n=1 Tax=Halobellus rubicundus TaxID=2996466 RepID=A0ABD5MCZ1_9EURY
MASTRVSLSRLAVGDSLFRAGVVGLVLIGLTLSIGIPGVVVAACVGFGWWFVPGYFAFGFGQIAFAATHAGLGGPGGLFAQIGLWGLLAADFTAESRPRSRAVRDLSVGSLGAVAVVWGLAEAFDPLWQVVLAFGALSAGSFYVIHRYQLVRMGLVGETT